MKKIITSIIVCTLILFLLSGVAQMLPWGIPTTQNISEQSLPSEQQDNIPNLIKFPPNTLTSEEFDNQFINKISTYTTDHTFSWIVTQPIQNDYSGYFIKEILTQLIVGILLTILLLLTITLKLKTRLTIIVLFGLLAVTSTYGQLMNWWQLPASYAIGVGINLIIGWLITSFIVARFILKSK